MERFVDDALASERRIAVNEDGHCLGEILKGLLGFLVFFYLFSVFVFVVELLGASLSLNNGIHSYNRIII